ncbi:MAG: WG repeat-containing protein, partial [candidate division WOR-3 bacterium]
LEVGYLCTDQKLFYEKIARVSKNELWGFIDIMGKEIVPPKYESAHDFSQGLAEVVFEGKSGFIDALGNEYWK